MIKTILFVVILIHGLLHLLGFLKAYNIGQVNQLSLSISKAMGLAWLLAGLLSIVTGLLYYSKIDWWWMLGVASVMISQILIFNHWQDAKFGTIANTMVLLITILGYGKWEFNSSLNAALEKFLPKQTEDASIISEKEISHLPAPVREWLLQSKVIGKKIPEAIHLYQSGQMKLKPDSEWLEVNAEQWFTINQPGFIWNASVGQGSLVQFAGRDTYTKGSGNMLIKLYSLIPIVNENGREIDQGAATRYLAEMVWFPSAAISEYISWEAIDSHKARASLTYQGQTVEGLFTFNERGQVVGFETKRYYDKTRQLQTWRIAIDANSYKDFDGISVPTKASVTWVLPHEEFTWYQLEVTDVSVMIEPE